MFKKDCKKESHTRVKEPQHRYILFVLVRREEEQSVRDCKVIPGETCLSQHRLLSRDVKVKNME
jgi:hypothetical protein